MMPSLSPLALSQSLITKAANNFGTAKQAIGNKAYGAYTGVKQSIGKTATAGRDLTVASVKDAAKFAIGANNVSIAYQHLTQARTYKIEKNSVNETVVKLHDPSYVERVRNATGELTIGAAKVVGWTMFSHGGICKAGAALGLMDPCSTLSLSGLNQAVFTGVTSTTAFATKVGLVVADKVVIPAGTFVAKTIFSNPINAAALGATGTMMYWAAKDISAMSKPANVQIKGNEIVVDMSSVPTFYGKLKLGAMATAKMAVATAIIAGTIAYNGTVDPS